MSDTPDKKDFDIMTPAKASSDEKAEVTCTPYTLPSAAPAQERQGWFVRLIAKTANADGVRHAHQLDEGARILREAGDIDWDAVTPEEYKNVRKKIDRHLLPLMMALYLVQFAGEWSSSHLFLSSC
jgi:hypothetical protein